MLPDSIIHILGNFFDFLDSPQWRAWPFNSGYGEHMVPAIARMVFVAMIFGAIILFLRMLFGPKGFLRDEEMDREAEEEIRRERAELEKKFADGEISEAEYVVKMKSLKD